MPDNNRVKFQDTHPMDKKLMDRIGWSEGGVASFISSYSTFKDEEKDEQQQQQKPKRRVQDVEIPQSKVKVPEKAAAAAAKKDKGFTVVEDV